MSNRPNLVSVMAPARLHMGFMDLSGALGRDFGSIGVGLNELYTQVNISPQNELTVIGDDAERAAKYVRLLCHSMGVSDALRVEVAAAIPEHVGLGSGTQMALAIGIGIARFYGLPFTVRQVAVLADRGARSGIGIGIFEEGGLVVDGGRGPNTLTPPLLARMAVPDDWRFILAFDRRGQGLHGEQEISAFRTLPPFARSAAERLCYLLLMQALPAVAENDLERFGEVITALQTAVGEHFAPVQGGVFTSAEVAAAMDYLHGKGARAIGQTSWGPTGFCLTSGAERAEEMAANAALKFNNGHLEFKVFSPRNAGAEILLSG